ncbi:HEAT repeat domain-containing protein [bacterium]|nr:HEAT repeat domain-containing protein [bacterium]
MNVGKRVLSRRLAICLTGIMVSLLIQPATPQEDFRIPDFFVEVEAGSRSLKTAIREARRELKLGKRDRKFWVGYRFSFREDIEFSHIQFHDGGGISFTRGDHETYYEDDDLENHVWRALDELGIAEAKEWIENQRRDILRKTIENWGVFYLFDSKTLELEKVKVYHFRQRRLFDDYPVAWLGDVENRESFNFLAGLVEGEHHTADVVKPAIFVLSTHDHPEAVPFLKHVAGGRDLFEIRKTAAFWLGQIPQDNSFDALKDLFDAERKREMKEKLVFSISQHQSDRRVRLLERIARKDEDVEIQKKAVFWLGQIDGDDSLDILRDLLNSTRRNDLKEKIVFSISQHGGRDAPNILIDVARNDPSLDVRKKAIFWLGQMAGRKTLQALGEIVEREEETELKTKAVFAISQHHHKELAVEMLMDIAQSHPHPEVRKKAMFWLGQTGDRRAIDFFKKVLTR